MKDIYKELSKLFPFTLAVGDVVEDKEGNQWIIKEVEGELEFIYCYSRREGIKEFFSEDLKLIRKNISLSMVLEAWRIKEGKNGLTYFDKMNHLTVYFDVITILDNWILGKSLYDQSEETIKFIWEVLK